MSRKQHEKLIAQISKSPGDYYQRMNELEHYYRHLDPATDRIIMRVFLVQCAVVAAIGLAHWLLHR